MSTTSGGSALLLLLLALGLTVGACCASSSSPLGDGTLYSLQVPSAGGEWQLRPVLSPEQPWDPQENARGAFNDTIMQEGWARLRVYTNPDAADDLVAAREAGRLEGVLCGARIYQHAVNLGYGPGYKPPSAAVGSFIDKNNLWMDAMVEKQRQGTTDERQRILWHQVNLILMQLRGISEGYQEAVRRGEAPSGLQYENILYLNLDSDLEDLVVALDPSALRDMRLGDAASVVGGGHCSSLVQLTDGNEQLLTSQSTWSSLNSMLRIFKMYDFPFHTFPGSSRVVAGRRISFSSYPGVPYSGDDYYAISSGLVVQETTIGNSNAQLYREFIFPETVMEWIRNMLANRLAATGPDWIEAYSQYNSGTYNNMNMIIDYNLFRAKEPLRNHTFWVCEQLPGYISSVDLSQHLQEHGYFASYNVPFQPLINRLSGNEEAEKKYGSWFSYAHTARAEIFRREQPINSLAEMQHIMRFNDFKHDPLSSQMPTCDYINKTDCSPWYTAENAIAARDDLNDANGVYAIDAFGLRNHVQTDVKITSSSLFDKVALTTLAQSGPTYDQQPVFQWKGSPYESVSHLGLPDRFEFPWVTIAFPEPSHRHAPLRSNDGEE